MTHTPDELRILSTIAPTMLRLLAAREKRILDRIYGDFRNGKQDYLTALAEYACVRDQIHEINSAIQQYENQPRE